MDLVDWDESRYDAIVAEFTRHATRFGIEDVVAVPVSALFGDNIVDRSGYGRSGFGGLRPADVLQRNFWFCTIDDPSTIDCRHRIGLENIMLEVDYPHGDSTWPDTQLVIEKAWGHLPADELRMLCSGNAAKLYRHPLPAVVLPSAVPTLNGAGS